MKQHIDIKLVFTGDIDHAHTQLKETLKQVIDKPGLDIFLKHPGSNRYDRVRP